MRSVLLTVVSVVAFLALASRAELDADLCQVRASAVCGRKGCAFGRGSWSPSAACQVKCADCEGSVNRRAVLYTQAEFATSNCTRDLRSISAGWSGACKADHSVVSCTRDMCTTHRFAGAGCRGERQLIDVAASGVCLPTGNGGAQMWGSTAAASIHPFSGETACPYKDVHKIECAVAIAECIGDCFGGFEACLQCIISTVGSSNGKICCQTLSYYVGFDCSDCDSL